MRFTQDEQIHLIAALETYNDVHRGFYGKRLQHDLVASALSKLNAQADVESFSHREYAVMFLALSLVTSELDESGIPIPDKLRDLCFFLKTHAGSEFELTPLTEFGYPVQ